MTSIFTTCLNSINSGKPVNELIIAITKIGRCVSTGIEAGTIDSSRYDESYQQFASYPNGRVGCAQGVE